MTGSADIRIGHVLTELAKLSTGSVHCVCTSPPFWGLRDYKLPPVAWAAGRYVPMLGLPPVEYPAWTGQLGLEDDPLAYVGHLIEVFREVDRVLRNDGTLWLDMGDCYSDSGRGGSSSEESIEETYRDPKRRARFVGTRYAFRVTRKQLLCLPWRVALALQADGWILRQRNHWIKTNPMPESCGDRTTNAQEYVFHFSHSRFYYYDSLAIAEQPSGRAHSRGRGVNPKVTNWMDVPGKHSPVEFSRIDREGPGSRMHVARDPAHADRALRSRQNESFSATVVGVVAQRNCRNVWTFPTEPYKGKHTATFPRDLVRRPILAGTSARGCCPACGAPWERIVSETNLPREEGAGTAKHDAADRCVAGHRMIAGIRAARQAGGEHDNPFPPKQTLGWRATCDCPPADPVPCTVLDPFAGTGTTGAVALEYGRNVILIDQNPANEADMRDRIAPHLGQATMPL